MLGRTYERENCSAARTLELVGERWSLLIIRNALFAGATRFTEFQVRLGVAPNVLTRRLQDFVAHGLMEIAGGGHEYHLTEKGRELGAVVVALTEWGDRWAAPDGPPVRYAHRGCGGTVATTPTCGGCGTEPSMADVVAEPGPGATPEQRQVLEARLTDPGGA